MGVPTGGNLGQATGSITINTSQLAAARAAVNAFATGVNTTLTGINPAIGRAQAGFGNLAGSVRGFAGAFGVSFGIAGIVQLGKMAVASTQAATAYRRQEVAARSLAGSQQVLNELLAAYEKATGGAVDKATALADVTNLQAIGFAKNAKELERFVVAARGISIARGRPQGETVNELALTIANQSTRRFDQIGLSISEVNKRINELRENNRGLTREMAFQEAVLQIATEKYGALATGAAGQATGIERLSKSWNDFGLKLGQLIEGPVNAIGGFFAKGFESQTKMLQEWVEWLDKVEAGLRRVGILGKDLSGSIGSRTTIGRVTPQSFSADPFVEGAREVRLNWAESVNDLNKRLYNDINDAERDYGRQRAETIRSYNTGLLREQRDFAINRQRAEEDMLESIADIHRDALRRETRMAEDLARSIADAQADSGERIAEAREDTNKRLVDLEEDYAKDRERAAEEHRDRLLSAAGRLDAIALLEERKRYARESKDAKEAHEKQRDDLQEQLDERIDDENKALEKSVRQQREAYDRQLADARENDRLRLQDMQDDFRKQKERADADRQTRLNDQAADHQAQLDEMDRAQGERIAQIKRHAADERTELDNQAKEDLLALGVRNEAWQKVQDAKEEALEKMWDKFMGHVSESLTAPMQGPQPKPGFPSLANPPSFAAGGAVLRSGWARVHAGEFVMPNASMASATGTGGRSISVGNISVSIMGTTNMGESQLKPLMREVLVEALEEVGGRN